MTADLVTRLRGWLDEDTPIGVIMNEAAARIEALEAENARLREALEKIEALPGEINPSNYAHDDVCCLNDAFVEGVLIARAALEDKA